ncbi:MAG: MgtC/SapB family protein [Phascolarctobacterium sp.]|jgi:putative Mg2+ transporter-C (MgtC) family protein|nr:MgtC/SapB family protein [Phascolarctobacterium sp.]MBQ5600742.1 MgtC/SapB family protein [Phascolarctobacterium sp.]MBQ6618174.1 MgtC/SapB family protein [Phascolarctobacterium sp.]
MFEIPWVSPLELTMVLRLIVAAILGGIVGMERGSGDRPAGFRTHILVCVGSALFMLVSIYGFDDIAPVTTTLEDDIGTRRDTARIAAQVVSGIGFLGAGTILHEGLTIKGLTTAASLWIVSAIGLAVGSGMYLLSTVATMLTMLTLVTFRTWEKRFAGTRSDRRFIRVVTRNTPGIITEITAFLSDCGIKVKTLNVKTDNKNGNIILELYLKIDRTIDMVEVADGIQNIDGVLALENAKSK